MESQRQAPAEPIRTGGSPPRSAVIEREGRVAMPEDATLRKDVSGELRRGQEVLAGHEAIGEVLDVHTRDGVKYVDILRFGPGGDQIYVPTIAIKQVVGNHVYLDLIAPELLGQAWHDAPERGAAPGRG